MKKVFTMALMAALMLGMTSCINGEEDTIVTSSVYMYNSVEDIETSTPNETLKQSLVGLEVNYTKGTIDIDASAFVAPGVQVKFKTGTIQMTTNTNGFSFSAASLPATGATVKNFNGFFDPTVGMLRYEFTVNDSYRVYSTAAYAYNFSVMNVYDAPGGELLYTTDEVAFGFIPKNDENKCTFVMNKFRLDDNSKVLPTLSFDGPTYVTTVGAGLNIKGDNLKNSEGYTGFDIKDLNALAWNKALAGQATFFIDGKYVEIQGTMFYTDDKNK